VSLRVARRAVALGWALTINLLRYFSFRIRGPLSLEQRALWMHLAGATVLSSLGIHSRVEGDAPEGGLVVSNHLSYLDIVILAASMRCFFVAKAEISSWPYFGLTARMGGTMFIDRSSRSSAVKVANEIAARLPLPIPIVLFPEGTSTDGSSVLRFYTHLFEPAVRAASPVTAASVRYVFDDGTVERDLCWYGDEGFLPHLWRALGTPGFTAEIRFGVPRVYPDRRTAAAKTHVEVTAMRSGPCVMS